MVDIIDITNVLLLLIVCAYFAVMVKYDVQMLQQNSYRNERYSKWLNQNNESIAFDRIMIYLAFILSLSNFLQSWIVELIVTTILAVMIVLKLKKKYKKPLVFTNRVKRLYFVELFIAAIFVALTAIYRMQDASKLVLVLIALSYLFTKIVNKLLQPLETHINNNYVKDAKRILSQMPNMTIIGITGSYGKTSTKHYLNRILSEKYSVLMTPGSFNTPMGVVRTIRENLQPYNDLFIVEMGAKNIGDIKEICDIVHPQMGIVTAVGPQHLESFKTIENVQRTKFELIDSLPSAGFAVVNNDFEYIANRVVENVEVKRYSVNNSNCDYYATDVEYSSMGTSFTIVSNNAKIELFTKLVGECNISNLIASVIIALKLGVPEQKIKYAVSKIEQVEHRLNLKRTASGITIIDDAFNSNPDGSKMALDVLSKMDSGNRIVITPGMIELGEKQAYYNEKFGEKIAETCDIAIIVGQYNRDAILKGIENKNILDKKNIIVANTFSEAQQIMLSFAKAGDVVLYENDLPDTFK